ncbi:hypothetical protein [Prosthecochloris sp. HL-130-GSB]|jgi:hypothetical protein|uniref:hypothetical protein n=1 Tax=Prosthecochloris sp. HL-130-GSB TaxID=1974213 RepID=UPI000A1C1900|nr:hypothetical protein [Prosthecochloris sp. HL-130-GSB]ARM30692.1 hypothetical protein B9H02_04350 [Prosthecochloris sp. HL-130-GSB]
MRTFSCSEDKKRGQEGSCKPALKKKRTFSAGLVWGTVMLAISFSSGCGQGGDGGNSGGSSSGHNSDYNRVSGAQGEIDPKWPGDELPKSVPPIAGAKVLRSMQDGDVFGVVFMCKRGTIEAYIQHLEQIGWNTDKDMGDDDLGAISRFLSNDEGEYLQVFWHGGSGNIGYSKE